MTMIKSLAIAVTTVLVAGLGTKAQAATVSFSNQADFLQVAGPLSLESFEALENPDEGEDSTPAGSIIARDFTVTGIPSEYNQEFDGVVGVPAFPDPSIPTDGQAYLQYDSATTPFEDPGPDYSDDRILRFDFKHPINRFGRSSSRQQAFLWDDQARAVI